MRLYVAWYPGDPIYSDYDDDCAMLVSPTSVANRWKVTDFPRPPRHFIVDSGGFRYGMLDQSPNQKFVFERQMHIANGVDTNVTLCQLDYPLIDPVLTSNQRDRLIHRTIANAYEFRNLGERRNVSKNISLMGIVQGYDIPSTVHCARELLNMGYMRFGIGSLALVFNMNQIEARIQAVIDVVGTGVHVFGVTGEKIAPRLRRLGVGSIDSSSPAKAAMFNIVFSSEPFKRHRIRPTRGTVSPRTAYIDKPFVCLCPACNGRANPNLLKVGKREYVFLRTLHNYYHLKQALGQPIASHS